MNPTPEKFEELALLACAAVEGRISHQQRDRLEQLLKGNADAQRFYRDYIDMHVSLEFVLATPAADRNERSESLPALAALAAHQRPTWQEPRKQTATLRKPSFEMSPWRIAAIFVFIASAVMTLTSPAWLGWWNHTPIAVVADAVNAQWVTADGTLDVGDHLPYGPLQLKSGYARIRLDNGVNLVVQAPARFSVDSLSLAHLDEGKITADVPHSAIGYTVKMRNATVTDLGTTFGVTAFANGEATVQVLKGSVQARLLSEDGSQKQAAVLQEDHAVAFNPATETLASIPPTPDAYVTDIRRITVHLAVHNTGADLQVGDADRNWTIAANSDDRAWTPKAGVVTDHRDNWYPAGETNDSQWLSTAHDWPSFSTRNQLTYTTTIDLTGLEPATAQLHLAVRTDNDLVELRLNGHKTDFAFTCTSDREVQVFHEYTLDHGFLPGKNTLEFVVANEPFNNGAVRGANPMGLRVELNGTALQSADGQKVGL
jgi:hypothetical protein